MVVILKNGFVTSSIVTNESPNNLPSSTQNGHRLNSSFDNQRCNFIDVNSNIRCDVSTECKKTPDKANFCKKHLRLLTNWKRRSILKKRIHRKSSFPENFSSQNGVNLDDYYDAEDFRKPVELTNIPAQQEEVSFDDDEILSHTGIYTTEEVVRITLEKLVKLRSKYVEYLNVLNRRMEIGEKLEAQKIKEGPDQDTTACNGYASCQKKEAFRALKVHGRISRRERLLGKFREDEKLAQRGFKNVCVFSDVDITTCRNESMINSTYCKSHILQDSGQILYAQCSQEGCREIVLRMNEKCVGHSKLF